MRGTNCPETFASVAALPPDALALLDNAPGLFAGRAWWDVVQSHAIPAGSEPLFVTIRTEGRVVAMLPMLRTGSRLSSLTTPYTCEYMPLLSAGLSQSARIAAMTAFGALCRGRGSVRLDALPAEWVYLSDLETGVREAGLRVLRFDHFGNWHEDVATLDWSGYLVGRPGALRETIRRRLRRAEKLPDARFDLFTQPAQMDQAVEAFESVYSRSWKDAEPFPTFNAALIRSTAALGLLRLGVWSIGSQPAAVQFWVVRDGRAIVLKLAHDEAFKAHSPGTVLTALMVRHLLDQEHVAAIDFGRGDDAYKQGWATRRRQRIGMLLVNPWRMAGAMDLLRHTAGRVRAAVTRR
ncbi:GNAT family N-acetyltransferase [Acidisphaera sp. S103]|uniref:GNAT family N-acetyltransferase n=1 Tax=Acidisphaera sp. S103 TaxID=1747223 RepID=UPI00131B9DC2|nr:GNAT family N-acetyltransferase [Acidisphaera sp. S103]